MYCDTQELDASQNRGAHLRSFEEIGIGNPGKEKTVSFRIKSPHGSNHYNSLTKMASRPQHLVKQAGGKLYVVKAEGQRLEVRRTEFELQSALPRANLMNDPLILVEFDCLIAQGIWMAAYKNEGEYTCSFFVPLTNNTLIQLYFTLDGLKTDSTQQPLISTVNLIVPSSGSRGGQAPGNDPVLLRVERMYYTSSDSNFNGEFSYFQKVATCHGDDQVYVYNIPVAPAPTSGVLGVRGGAVTSDSRSKGGLWGGIKDSILGSFMKPKVAVQTYTETIEEIKFLGCYLICAIYAMDGIEYQARVFNLYTGEVLASLDLKIPETGTAYKVKTCKKDWPDSV